MVMSAAAGLTVLMMVVMMLVFFFLFIVMVVMMVLMFLIFVIVVVMMVLMFLIFVIVVVMMVLMLLILIVMVVMMMMLMLVFLFCENKVCEGNGMFHCCQNLSAGQVIPGCCDDHGILIMLSEQSSYGFQLILADILGTAEHDGIGTFYLVIVELAKVLHIHLALICVGNCDHAVDLQTGILSDALYCKGNIRKLSNAGGLDDDAVRVELLNNLTQSCIKVTNQRAADASGIHLCDIDAGIL